MRQKPVTIEVRKHGENWAVLAEEQLVTLAVYQKGAEVLQRTLRGLLRYTSRKLFRRALAEALKEPEPLKGGSKSEKNDRTKPKLLKVKTRKATSKPKRVKIEVKPSTNEPATPSSNH